MMMMMMFSFDEDEFQPEWYWVVKSWRKPVKSWDTALVHLDQHLMHRPLRGWTHHAIEVTVFWGWRKCCTQFFFYLDLEVWTWQDSYSHVVASVFFCVGMEAKYAERQRVGSWVSISFYTRWWFHFSFFLIFTRLQKWSNMTHIFQFGWNHHPAYDIPWIW